MKLTPWGLEWMRKHRPGVAKEYEAGGIASVGLLHEELKKWNPAATRFALTFTLAGPGILKVAEWWDFDRSASVDHNRPLVIIDRPAGIPLPWRLWVDNGKWTPQEHELWQRRYALWERISLRRT